MKKSLFILIFTWLFLIGCHSDDHTISQMEAPTVSTTKWTDKMEIFMEYETPVAGHEIKFIIHLTNLRDFQPVRDGKVSLNFLKPDGKNISIEKDNLLREGIFTPINTFQESGDYSFSLQYQGSNISETFTFDSFTVYSSFEEVAENNENSVDEEITFLKEQQWKLDFATEEAQVREIKTAIHTFGEVRPQPASYAEIVSPVEGIISIEAAGQLVNPGQKVQKGQILAVLVPPLAAQDSWAEIYLNYEAARAEFERAKRLEEKNAISGREFEQIRRNYELRKAGIANHFGSESSSIQYDAKNHQFQITAPINGIVTNVAILPGQNVDREQKLFSIVNPSTVWLKIELYADQAKKIDNISGASISIPGNKNTLHLGENSIKLISRGEIIDPRKQTVTFWLEADNRQKSLMIGQTFNAQIYTSTVTEMLALPVSAVYDDNSQKIIFLHTAGESFETREVTIGPIYNNYIGIISGLKAGERVVTSGGYQVKLASTSETIGHAHTH